MIEQDLLNGNLSEILLKIHNELPSGLLYTQRKHKQKHKGQVFIPDRKTMGRNRPRGQVLNRPRGQVFIPDR